MIMVVDSDPELVVKTRKMLFRLGLPTLQSDFAHAYKMIEKHPVQVVYLPRPIAPGRPTHFCQNIKRRYNARVATIMTAGHEYDGMEITDPATAVVRAPFSPVSIARRAFKILREKGYRDQMCITVHWIYVHRLEFAAFCGFHYHVHLTDNQTAVLHTMMDVFPKHLSVDELLEYSAKPGRTPSRDGLIQTISGINKATQAEFGRRMIAYHPKIGYYLNIWKGLPLR